MVTMWPYGDGDGKITASELQQADRETQLEVMRNWFFSIYEDPVENTPYESAEGGYIYIWGGPYEASEKLADEFWGTVPDEVIDELVSELNDISWVWTKHPESHEEWFDEFENSIQNALPDPLPSPVSFEIRDGAVHKAPHPTPAPSDERRTGAESAWTALKELLADLAESSAGQNHPRIGRVLDRCRAAFGDEFNNWMSLCLESILRVSVRLRCGRMRS